MGTIRAQPKSGAQPDSVSVAGKIDVSQELQLLDLELQRHNEQIREKLESGIGTITEYLKDLEIKSQHREADAKKAIEREFQQKLAEVEKRMQEELRRRDERILKIEQDFKNKAEELRKKFDSDLRKKDEEMLQLVEKKNQEREAAVLETYRIIETQSDIITKVMEKNERLILEVLSELDITIEDLRKMLDSGPM